MRIDIYPDPKGRLTEVYFDGKPITNIRRIDYEHSLEGAPVLRIEFIYPDLYINDKDSGFEERFIVKV